MIRMCEGTISYQICEEQKLDKETLNCGMSVLLRLYRDWLNGDEDEKDYLKGPTMF
jgi:hypothetical protein